MRLSQPPTASQPTRFGRGALACPAQASAPATGEDLRLFATSYVLGFLFVAVLIF